jgi:hypothetical protein
MLCDASELYVWAHVATPLDNATDVQLPMGVPPSSNVTVPVGVPVMGALAASVAVYVTVCPYTDGLAELVIVVVEGLYVTKVL